MPQLFQVLRCLKCGVFQVHQVKKANKWECKVCGEKQSIKRHYGIGTGKDCRLHVQKLNGIKREIDEIGMESNVDISEVINNKPNTQNLATEKRGKWSSYVDEIEENIQDSEDTFSGHNVLESPNKYPKNNRSYERANNKRNRKTRTLIENLPFESVESNKSDLKSETSNSQIISSDNQCMSTNRLVLDKNVEVGSSKNSIKKYDNAFFYPVAKVSKWDQFLNEKESKGCFQNKEQPLKAGSDNFVNDNKSGNIGNFKINDMFSMCDDSDIDDVLKF